MHTNIFQLFLQSWTT